MSKRFEVGFLLVELNKINEEEFNFSLLDEFSGNITNNHVLIKNLELNNESINSLFYGAIQELAYSQVNFGDNDYSIVNHIAHNFITVDKNMVEDFINLHYISIFDNITGFIYNNWIKKTNKNKKVEI